MTVNRDGTADGDLGLSKAWLNSFRRMEYAL